MKSIMLFLTLLVIFSSFNSYLSDTFVFGGNVKNSRTIPATSTLIKTCGCQCSNLGFRGSDGKLQGNCLRQILNTDQSLTNVFQLRHKLSYVIVSVVSLSVCRSFSQKESEASYTVSALYTSVCQSLTSSSVFIPPYPFVCPSHPFLKRCINIKARAYFFCVFFQL